MLDNTREAAAIATKTLQWSEQAILRAHQVSGPLLSKDATLRVEAIEAMQTRRLEYKAPDKRIPTADLYPTEFTLVRLERTSSRERPPLGGALARRALAPVSEAPV